MTTSSVVPEEVVSAAEANRQFSRILREVREGRTYLVTSHGRPVARIVPANGGARVTERAHATLLARLRAQAVVDIGSWSREELYEGEDLERSR